MKKYEEICKHVLDCIEAVYDGAEIEDKCEWSDPVEGGMHLIINDFVASLEPRENADLTLEKFIRYNHYCLTFEYGYDQQERLLKSWGIESDDVDTDYHRVIYPFVKMAYDDVMEGKKMTVQELDRGQLMEYTNGLLEFKRKYIAKNWNRVPTDGEIQSLLDFKKRTFWNTNAGAVFLPDVTKNNCYSYDRYLKKFFKGKVIFDNKSELGFYIDDFSETKRVPTDFRKWVKEFNFIWK